MRLQPDLAVLLRSWGEIIVLGMCAVLAWRIVRMIALTVAVVRIAMERDE